MYYLFPITFILIAMTAGIHAKPTEPPQANPIELSCPETALSANRQTIQTMGYNEYRADGVHWGRDLQFDI